MQDIQEGEATITNETKEIVTKDMGVFYNPIMKHNRDVGLLLLSGEGRRLQCCDLLAGSGIRSIRLLKEAPDVIENITINDFDPETHSRIKKNLEKNKINFDEWSIHEFLAHSHKTDGPGNREESPLPPVVISNLDGSQLLLSSNGYDYIDIDPFGSPNTFLDAACKRISRGGILALTFTDTSALAGSYPEACERKYWGKPTEGARIHEVGLRLLIRKVQLVAAQYDKALTPILVYNHDHYYRAYFRSEKGKQKCDKLLANHGVWEDEPESGPLWLGRTCDPQLIERMMAGLDEENELCSWLKKLKQENNFEQPGHYFDLNTLQQEIGSKKKEEILEWLGNEGSPVHYEGNAIKTSKSKKEIQKWSQSTKE